jgi:hypothetical protein
MLGHTSQELKVGALVVPKTRARYGTERILTEIQICFNRIGAVNSG